ncbi:hypothetical protein T492DRAFT_435983 [Pavlovales sp. CCMP2436]|nr:hypothetical protein T492DRAFT_435983 [Pavlovales sp. CCMP2436]
MCTHSYVRHLETHPASLLPRFTGLHQLRLPGGERIDFVVMANVFATERRIHERYDLKGSTVGRSTNPEILAAKPGTVRKDLDLDGRQFHVGHARREVLLQTLRADVAWLASVGSMDYSLLIGCHKLRPRGREAERTRAGAGAGAQAPPADGTAHGQGARLHSRHTFSDSSEGWEEGWSDAPDSVNRDSVNRTQERDGRTSNGAEWSRTEGRHSNAHSNAQAGRKSGGDTEAYERETNGGETNSEQASGLGHHRSSSHTTSAAELHLRLDAASAAAAAADLAAEAEAMARGAEGRRTEGGDVDAKYELARKQSMLLTLGAGAGGTPSKGMAMKGGTNARGGGREAYPFGFSADSAPSLSDFPEATPGAAEGFRQLEKGGALPGSAGPGAGAGERQSDNSQLANQSNQSNHSQSPAAAAHLSSGHRHSISNGSYSLNMHNVHSTGDAGPRSPPAAPPPLADTHDGGVFR